MLRKREEIERQTGKVHFFLQVFSMTINFNRIKIKIKNIDREETGENVSESWNEDR